METLIWLVIVVAVIVAVIWGVAALRRTFSKEINRAKRIRRANQRGE